jgi:hypothetical protein
VRQARPRFFWRPPDAYAENLDLEDDMIAEAQAGIADAGRYVTISTPEDAEARYEQKMARALSS